ncbi:unnamed protein product [Caenorhabditis auriculariae]|uniref:Uncharacterized protein n=1 Tax=Caenorhabditis auriculariae TaxID=2777116 RepID=A0A8S1HHN5_9PELO|nr:unnamed protein product [Caenorhabditis auriculariae]
MEVAIEEAIIYNAAQHGNLKRIEVFLQCNRSTDWIESCLNSSENDKIPLVVAARHGFVDVVRYLLSKGANPSVTGVVSFDGEHIYGTPPLWAAAAAGHFEVVKVLVEEANACVNQPTSTHSTALRGACYDGHLEIVRYLADHGADLNVPNRHGHTSLMIAAFRNKIEVVKFLISRGVDVSVQTSKGNSALHDAAEGGNVEIVKVLLEAGAELLPDENGLCPLISSAMCGNSEVVEILLGHTTDKLKKRDALKLLGCTMVDKKMDVNNGLHYWKRAVEVPLSSEDLRVIHEQEVLYEPNPVYDSYREVNFLHEIVDIENNLDSIRMQSLLIRERILGGSHPDVHYYLRFRGAVYCDLGRKDRCYVLWKHALDLQQQYFSPLHIATVSTLQSFQETFAQSLNDHVIHMDVDRPLRFNVSLVEYVFNQLCHELERLVEWGDKPLVEDCCNEDHTTDVDGEKRKLVLIGLQLMLLVDRLSLPTANMIEEVQDEKELDLDVNRFVLASKRLKIPILHLALEESDRQESQRYLFSFRNVGKTFVERLLRENVDVNEMDERKNSPIHVLLDNEQTRMSLIKVLLDHGSYLFARNKEGKRVIDSIRRINSSHNERIPLAKYVTLKGLAASVVRSKVDHEAALNLVPIDLRTFLEMH